MCLWVICGFFTRRFSVNLLLRPAIVGEDVEFEIDNRIRLDTGCVKGLLVQTIWIIIAPYNFAVFTTIFAGDPEDHLMQLNILTKRSDILVLLLEIQDSVNGSVVANGDELTCITCEIDLEFFHGGLNRSCSFSSWNGIRCANRFASRS